ncbi:stomatal closure-related actin-binding protein 3 [Morus notabilis]|uniref:stomatal closure-related actin-binding protein 3 n=1 Tax=Morus notabilis TaxID=981085 RepID=UPI000CED21C6|nr:stomatal closure-related actin-binding protein 3 [Morus notabilis]XP_024019534.1 stomatal closure-related actin-binding protein 3 [Morus notabilis]
MTKVSPEVDAMDMDAVLPVSADVSFKSNHFPKYKLGADNQILEEPKEDNNGPSLKEVVEQETTQLSEQHKRLSVRDLACKFDKNLTAAAKLSEEAKLREVASLEGHVLLKKLRDALEHLRGRMAGRNKEDVEKAISMVEALAVKLTQNEGELIQEKFEVKKLANFLKQASEDAKKLVNQEKSFACAEIESARAVVQRIGEALDEQDRISQASKEQSPDVEGLLEEVQEARRIKLLHQPSKMMEMEHELRALRTQIREKFMFSVKLQKELAISKRAEENKSRLYMLDGSAMLGSYLRIQVSSDEAPQLSKCSIQWYRVSLECNRDEVISGANKPVYAPEPLDVGRILQADICFNGQKASVMTPGPIDPAAGLGSHVETLMRKSNSEFNVVISKMNGQDYSSHSVHAFHVGKMRMKLCRGWITKAREIYSSSMQLCGYRGESNTAAKALFWQARKGLSFVLTFESERDRNAAITLARKYAHDCNVTLAGPDDQV